MVRLEKHGDSAVRFIFTDSDHYLYKDGVVDVPVNSLSLVIDESEMVTFKKASTADPFISFRLDKSNFSSRDELLTFYKENMVGAGGISEEEVQQMIDAATSGIPSSQVIEQLRNDVNAVSGDVENKIDTATYESGQYATAQALNALQENKLDASAYTPTDLSQYWTSGQTQEAINAATSGIPSSSVIEDLQTDVSNLQGETQGIWDTIDEKEEVIASALTQLNQDVSAIDTKEEVIASALTEVRQDVNKKANVCYVDFIALFNEETDITDEIYNSWLEARENGAVFYTSDTPADDGLRSEPLVVLSGPEGEFIRFYMYNDSGWQNVSIWKAGENEYEVLTDAWTYEVDNQLNSGSTNPVQNAVISQALNNKLDASAYTPTDLSEYWTSGQTQEAINAATSGIPSSQVIEQLRNDVNAVSGDVENKQDALVYYSEDTENKSANIHIEDTDEQTSGDLGVDGSSAMMFASGTETDVEETIVRNSGINVNPWEASMSYDKSIDDEPTTYSYVSVGETVGLGVQSDVDPQPYSHLNVNKGDISLEVRSDEDHITTFAVSNSAVTINDERVATEPYVDDVISGKVDTSAITSAITSASTNDEVAGAKAVYDQLGGLKFVKLTQAAYDALATKDSSTLYIISD